MEDCKMGRLAIRRVIYNGQKYYFESPYLNDGIIILEGENEHGKSTFMDLIYYGLGGKISGFNKSDANADNKHNEIYNDIDNYIELQIEINNKIFEFTRTIGDNTIYIVDPEEKVTECSIYRNSNSDAIIFSDWILKQLGIEVFDIIQGTKKFKLNFSDLMRLIYHDQKTEVDRIFKNPDNDNFIADSLEIRKAIFEVLLGEIYNEYYSLLGQYKLRFKEYEKVEVIMQSYDEFLNEVLDEELGNVAYIQRLKKEKEEMLLKVENERNIVRNEKSNTGEVLNEVESQKRTLLQFQNEKDNMIQAKYAVKQSIEKILYLIDESEKEISEIEKIRFVNRKLKLFSPNTCPYCLRDVERERGKCICGSDINEEDYEKFFYTDQEYVEIIKVKRKAIQSLSVLLEKKNQRLKTILDSVDNISEAINKVKLYIEDLTKDITAEYNSAYIRKLDDRIYSLNSEILKLEQAEDLAKKKESIMGNLTTLRNQVDGLRIKVDSCLINAKEDMLSKKTEFNKTYLELMKNADKYCFDAYLGDDYMPYINLNEYRARSASVSKRLMYFLTLLILSLQNDLNYPRFLMIDTPNKEGIDKENLIRNLKELSKAYELRKDKNMLFQVILTTGIDIYPEKFKKYVFLTLEGENRLLKEKVSKQ
jgi:predicted ATPase